MSKRKSQPPKGVAPQGPLPTPVLPPQGPAELLIRFAPAIGMEPRRLLVTVPGGRESSIPADPESMHALVAILERLGRTPTESQTIAQARAQAQSLWPVGLAVRFTPPRPSTWHDVDWWPRLTNGLSADFCPMTVQAEHANGSLLCTAPNGKNYLIPSRWAIPEGAAFHKKVSRPKGSLRVVVTLEELGL